MNNFLLADDHGIVRSGIKALLKEHFNADKSDEAEDENEVMQRVKGFDYDLILLDINMPGTDFPRLMDWLNRVSPDTRVLVFSMHPENIYGVRCLQLGAWGYLRKTASDEEIIIAIRRVLEGRKYISPIVAELLSQKTDKKKMSNPFHNLSSRELEIASLLNKGKSLPEICTVLNIGYSTVNTYKRRLFEKLMVPNVLSLSRLMQTFNFEC